MLSEKKNLNETKNHNPSLQVKWSVHKEKRGWDGKRENKFLTAMAWKRGELDRGGIFCQAVAPQGNIGAYSYEIYRWDLLHAWRVAPSTHVGLLWSAVDFPLIAWQLLKRELPYLAIKSPKVHTLVARGAEHPTPGQTLSTLSRLLRQAEICFRPILYDARDSHRAFETCALSKLCTLTIYIVISSYYILNIFFNGISQ